MSQILGLRVLYLATAALALVESRKMKGINLLRQHKLSWDSENINFDLAEEPSEESVYSRCKHLFGVGSCHYYTVRKKASRTHHWP